MKIGINFLLWTGKVTEQHAALFRTLKATGYDGVEIPIFDPANVGDYAKLGAMLDDIGLERTVSTAFPGEACNPIADDPNARAAALEFSRRLIDCCVALQSKLLVGPLYQPLSLFSGERPSEIEYERAAALHRALAPHASAAGVVCAIEPLNRFEAYLLNTCEQAAEYMARVGDPAIGILYDTFHAHIEEKDPIAGLEGLLADGVVKHIHISENDRGTPGRGHAKIRETIATLQKNKYDGWLTIEAFGRGVPELAAATRVWRDFFHSPEEVYEDGIRFIKACLAGA